MIRFLLIFASATVFVGSKGRAVEPTARDLFARENLVAWCIVPFDAKRRSPEERAHMLRDLGFTKFAYDWRAEHVPTFDEEIVAMKRAGVELTAWWFPAELNDDARAILAALARQDAKTQLWVSLDDAAPGNSDQSAKVAAAAAAIRPLAEAAARQGCSIGLYNHGGWFGRPENQVAIIDALAMDNVGIVYNLHHGHDDLPRLGELLKVMLPHLYAINLNGMDRDGERRGRKILPLGQGELDLEVMRAIVESGYRGPIGILGHTKDDVALRLLDNLDGLDWLTAQFAGKKSERPTPRTPVPAETK